MDNLPWAVIITFATLTLVACLAVRPILTLRQSAHRLQILRRDVTSLQNSYAMLNDISEDYNRRVHHDSFDQALRNAVQSAERACNPVGSTVECQKAKSDAKSVLMLLEEATVPWNSLKNHLAAVEKSCDKHNLGRLLEVLGSLQGLGIEAMGYRPIPARVGTGMVKTP